MRLAASGLPSYRMMISPFSAANHAKPAAAESDQMTAPLTNPALALLRLPLTQLELLCSRMHAGYAALPAGVPHSCAAGFRTAKGQTASQYADQRLCWACIHTALRHTTQRASGITCTGLFSWGADSDCFEATCTKSGCCPGARQRCSWTPERHLGYYAEQRPSRFLAGRA